MEDLLTIGFAGDVMLGRTLDSIISERGYAYPWGNLLPVMKQTHVNIINLENALTHSDEQVIKTFNFKATPEKIESLKMARITVVNLANNHTLDFDQSGLLETLDTLEKADIQHVGAGRNLAEAEASVFIRQKGVQLAVLGATDNEPGWKAGKKPGIHYIDIENQKGTQRILQQVENLRKNSDVVIVSIHWGPNMQEKPSGQFIKFAHDMIDHGASIIHGHSAHIIQGIERYKNGLIMYDTGDFVDDYAVDPALRNDLSAFFVLSLSTSGLVNLKIIPTRIFDFQVNQARQEDYAWVLNRIGQLSAEFNICPDNEGNIKLGG